MDMLKKYIIHKDFYQFCNGKKLKNILLKILFAFDLFQVGA